MYGLIPNQTEKLAVLSYAGTPPGNDICSMLECSTSWSIGHCKG